MNTEVQLRHAGSSDAGLEPLVTRLRRTRPLEFNLALHADADTLPTKAAVHLLPLPREGLSNVLRHAEDSHVWV